MNEKEKLLYALKELVKEVNFKRLKLNIRKDFSLINAHAYAQKVIHEVEAPKDVYGSPLETWHDVSHDGTKDVFAYATEQGTVMYGMDLDTKDKFFSSFSSSLYYMETAPDEFKHFDTLEEAKADALKIVSSLNKEETHGIQI